MSVAAYERDRPRRGMPVAPGWWWWHSELDRGFCGSRERYLGIQLGRGRAGLALGRRATPAQGEIAGSGYSH